MSSKHGSGQSGVKQLLSLDWDAIAGIVAAVLALVMHFLHLVDTDVLLLIAVVLIALLFIRDVRQERRAERMEESLEAAARSVGQIQSNLAPVDTILVGPQRLRAESESFSRMARGEMIWFHVCLLMFKPQSLFDSLLRPAIENTGVTSIQFVLDKNQQELWNKEVMPKIRLCAGANKVQEPIWTSIKENVSLIIAEMSGDGKTECLLSFWGEPFMAYSTERRVPRYIFRVKAHSDLIGRLIELQRSYRFAAS